MSVPLLLLLACGEEPAPVPPPEKPGAVLMISMDTTRADALSCYGDQDHWRREFPAAQRPKAATPIIDALAARGVRFAWALAQAPTTLSSHATVFSGRDPHRHSVPRNGYSVPGDFPLLAEWFAGRGWDTIAVLGSSALERKMGLDRGFRVYHDPGPQPPGGMYMLGADEVTRRALSAVDGRPDPEMPLFLFVHYYDPHMPWFEAPPEVVSRFARPDYEGPVDGSMRGVGFLTEARREGRLRFGDARQARALYLAQVAWVDHQIGVLVDGLATRGLTGDLLTVVFADHGETLDESASWPYTHGPEVGLVDIHVPLVFAGSGRYAIPEGVVVDRPVRLVDVATTVAGAAGFGGVLGDGEDLAPLWSGGTLPPAAAFAEATRPMDRESTRAWNNLPFERAVALDGFLLRVRPLEGGLATLATVAPGEPAADVSAHRARLEEMATLLRTWDSAAPAFRPPEYDAETEAALRALGYLGDPPTASGTPAR